MTPRAATVTFASILTAALLMRLWLVLAVPFGPVVERRLEGLNDEPAHYNYVKYLAEQRSLPVQSGQVRDPGAFERGDFEYYQPPLYYLVCAPLYALGGDQLGLTLCRLVSFACGVLSLWVLARILALLDCPPACRRLGVAFAALLPTHAYFAALVSNDAMSWLIALLVVHELLRRLAGAEAGPAGAAGAEGGPGVASLAAAGSAGAAGAAARGLARGAHLRLGLLIAAGLLTKSAIAVLLPLVVFVYGYLAWRVRRPAFLGGLLIALGVPLLVAGPWYARNVVLYGSPLALDVGFGPPEAGRTSFESVYHTIGSTIRYFWFPMMHVSPEPLAVAIRSVGGTLVAVHLLAAVAYFRRPGTVGAKGLAMMLLAVLMLAGHIQLNLVWGEAEGRFLFPALAAIVFLFVRPLYAYSRRWAAGDGVAWAWVGLAAVHPWALLAFA